MKFRVKVIKIIVWGFIFIVECFVDGGGEVWFGVLYEDVDILEIFFKCVIEFICYIGVICF